MKVSVIIPHWPLKPEHDDCLRRLVQSLPPVYEKLIIVNDGTGMGKAINKGLELATGDFFIVMNNDCWWINGEPEALCDHDCITIPQSWVNTGSFFCMPRWIYDKCGGYDEQFETGYWEDTDLEHRWKLAGIKTKNVLGVEVGHHGGTTLNKLPNRDEIYDKNKERFYAKWPELLSADSK